MPAIARSSLAVGSSTQKSEPVPTTLVNPTVPAIIAASLRVITSPMPVPSTGPFSCPAR